MGGRGVGDRTTVSPQLGHLAAPSIGLLHSTQTD